MKKLKIAFEEVHAQCRIEFLNNTQRAFSKYGHKQTTCETVEGSNGEIQEQIEIYQIEIAFVWKYYLLRIQHEI